MQVEQIAAIIAAANLGVSGTTLFVNTMPATVMNGIVVLPSLSGNQIDWELGSRFMNNATFQIIVRVPTDKYRVGYNLAESISKTLTIQTDTDISAIGTDIPACKILYMRPKHEIISYPRTQSGYIEFSVNYEMAYIK